MASVGVHGVIPEVDGAAVWDCANPGVTEAASRRATVLSFKLLNPEGANYAERKV